MTRPIKSLNHNHWILSGHVGPGNNYDDEYSQHLQDVHFHFPVHDLYNDFWDGTQSEFDHGNDEQGSMETGTGPGNYPAGNFGTLNSNLGWGLELDLDSCIYYHHYHHYFEMIS